MKTEIGFYKMHNSRYAVITYVDIAGWGEGYFQTPGCDVVKGRWCPDGRFTAWAHSGKDLNLKQKLI